MKRVNVGGIYQGPDSKPNAILDFHEKELAAYLARARGPGKSAQREAVRGRAARRRRSSSRNMTPRDPALYGEGSIPPAAAAIGRLAR